MQPEFQNTIIEFLQLLISPIAPEATFEFEKEGDQWRIIVNTGGNQLLHGKNNQTLKAIQHLLRVLVHKKFPEDRTHFLLDIDNNRRTREHLISNAIPTIAQQHVLTQGKTVILVNLSGYERMLVHKILADISGLNTTSVGPENSRKLLIMPTSEIGSGGMENAIILDLEKISEVTQLLK